MSENNNKESFCLGIICSFSPLTDKKKYEQIYQAIYKPLFSYFYNQQEIPIVMHMSGIFLEWLEKHHKEVFFMFEELLSKKQIEFLGGGYYSPLYPIIPSSDRVGQTELLTTALRKFTGKRPRGAFLSASAWDSALIPSFSTCGIEYVLLDKHMFEDVVDRDITGYEPIMLEDSGKTIFAIPVNYGFTNFESYSFENLKKIEKNNKNLKNTEQLTTIVLNYQTLNSVSHVKKIISWIDAFISFIKSNYSNFEITTPYTFLKAKKQFKRAYISSGFSPYICNKKENNMNLKTLSDIPLKQKIVSSLYLTQLYSKMIYVHALTNQIRGDKARKKNAREQLWQAQSASLFLYPMCINKADLRLIKNISYRNLLIAEKTSRIRGVFTSSINAYDFDMDGIKEFLCHLESYNCYIHSRGGKVFELDFLPLNKNFISIETSSDGLFIDHFFTNDEVASIYKGIIPNASTVFSNAQYIDTNIDVSKMELSLKTTGLFGSLQQPISLRKQYMFRVEGFQVQYILKNESPFLLSGTFMVELDFAITTNNNKHAIQVIFSGDTSWEGPISFHTYEDVSWLQLTDGETGARFTLDSNENPQLTIIPVDDGLSIKVYLSWKVELNPNFEMEKLVFIKISN